MVESWHPGRGVEVIERECAIRDTIRCHFTCASTSIFAVIAVLEVISAAFAWRDIKRRPAESIRGSKRFWRVVFVNDPGNSLLYWIVGRR